jgi:hypothetical protein
MSWPVRIARERSTKADSRPDRARSTLRASPKTDAVRPEPVEGPLFDIMPAVPMVRQTFPAGNPATAARRMTFDTAKLHGLR